ncbi:hypothetical protein SBA4_70037 [Candidatus Sulfopaludibacter sp. SbA4]|nr:hypothetical protein SBA4_70037 [Candidatus Sulfopaludibacter sp. SbA4]
MYQPVDVRTAAVLQNLQPTRRESQVLELVCDGYTTKEIAARLGITFKTVACHRASLMEKAGVHSSVALFRWALTSGLVSLVDRHDGGQAGGVASSEEVSNGYGTPSSGTPRSMFVHGVRTAIATGR